MPEEPKSVETKPVETKPVETPPPTTVIGSITDPKPVEAKPGETKPGEVKPTETKPDAITALTAADITIPAGFDADPAVMTEFVGLFNDASKSPKDRANALVALQAKVTEQTVEKLSDAWLKEQKEWADAIKNDPKIGGQKYAANEAMVAKVVEAYPDKAELRKALAETGFGNNLAAFKFFLWAAEQLGEGKLVQGAPGNVTKDTAKLLYPTMQQ